MFQFLLPLNYTQKCKKKQILRTDDFGGLRTDDFRRLKMYIIYIFWTTLW